MILHPASKNINTVYTVYAKCQAKNIPNLSKFLRLYFCILQQHVVPDSTVSQEPVWEQEASTSKSKPPFGKLPSPEVKVLKHVRGNPPVSLNLIYKSQTI